MNGNDWMILGLLLISTIIGAFGALFLKIGSARFRIKLTIKGITDIITNYKLILGIILYVLGSIAFIYALKFGELSVVYPLTSMGYIFIAILSLIFLKEHMNRYKWLGIAFIILGVVLVKI